MELEVEGPPGETVVVNKDARGEEGAEISLSAFEALERDFQEVLQTLAGDRSLDRFRIEYEKIHRALKRSHEHERKLVKKVRELNTEIVNNASKVHTALKLSQDDQSTIAALRKEIEKAWKLVETGQGKEVQSKETITQLREEISNLSKLVEKGAKLSGGQETMVKELISTRDELQRQTEEQQQHSRTLESQLAEQRRRKEEVEVENAGLLGKLASLEEQLDARHAEIQREQRRRDRLDRELRDSKTQLEKQLEDYEELNAEKTTAQLHAGQLEKQLSDARNTMDKYLRDYDTLYQRTQKLTEDLEEQITKNQQQHLENVSLSKEMKVAKDEVTRANVEKGQLARKVEREHRQALTYRKLLEASKTPLLSAQMEITALQKEVNQFKKLTEKKEKAQEALERDAKLAKKEKERAEQAAKVADTHVKEQERIAYSLESEMNSYKAETIKQRKQMYQLEKERERYGIEASDQRSSYLQAMEEVKLRDMRVTELQKKVSEWEAKLKQQQHLYESVRSDRNLYSKNLIEAQDEIAEMKRKFKIMNHQIEQLKEEISAKDQALVKESFAHEKVEKQSDQMRNEMSRMRKFIDANEDVIHKQDAEIRRLASMIRRMDDEALTQRKEYDQVINERDILGTQLIRRNDELALLYEKLKIQTSTLRKGEAQYALRVQDIQVLRLKIRDLQRELSISTGSSSRLDELRRELIAVQRELLQEKTKVKALSEELENPMNVHRWRKLEGSDPATYEMIQKIQTLQRRLIAKTEEVVEKDLLIQEKERLYVELKSVLARQPGPEVAEQLSVYQSSLRGKTRQMKAMASELNMYQTQVNEYKYEIERLTRDLQDVKRKYYEQKRREQLAKEMEDEDNSLGKLQAQKQLAMAQQAKTRFTGGGFAIR
ncbi:hypothetical protein CTAYLR_001018 [Chrysophaeum taylorii]|uniref:Cilia- and flagella-associated protein 58 central coiled coil domain-containing protein n=1 Tax=Chrysophaeum taylorii TaxID=2483200 RepID=A0AAD7UHR3_9STRA|nr:hypothetical protein CTAYLR_001018 [Chrysophaeum taylorii]